MLALVASAALASDVAAPPESRRVAVEQVVPKVGPAKALRFLALVQARGIGTNVVSTNPFLDGQVLGSLGGTNGMTVDPDARSFYVEQRAAGFLTWRPDVLDGKVGLAAAFEVDFAWGDRSYGVGGNTGGGFGADQVNLQTRRLHVDIWSKLGKNRRHALHLIVGLQFVSDSASDPTATTPDGLFRSGGRMMFFGSEAAGVSAYGSLRDGYGERLRYRVGGYTLSELGLGTPDDATLWMADATVLATHALEVGAHAWVLRDTTGGAGGVLGVGPSSSLSEMQGGPKLDPYGDTPRPDEDPGVDSTLAWFSLDAGYNPKLTTGPFGMTALALLNVGTVAARGGGRIPVLGQLYDLEARLRWARGKGSILRVEALYSTPDNGDATDRYTGVITGNSYGFAGSVHNTHGTRLLFSDPQSINRMTPLVADVSGAGQGLLGFTGTLGWDVMPNQVNLQVGGGVALAPQRGVQGSEVNARLAYEPWPFFTAYLAGAALLPGDQALIQDPAWAGHAGLEWVAF